MVAALVCMTFASCSGDDEEDYVTPSTSMVNFTESGGTQVIQVLSNTSWTVMGAQPWMTVTPMQGKGDGIITITTIPNTNATSNQGMVYISAGKASAQISVIQAAGSTKPTTISEIVSGVYVGKLTSGGMVVDDAYKVTITALNSTAVEVKADFFSAPVNFNVVETATGQYNLSNANYSEITMYVTGNTLNISFVNAAQTMTSYVGYKN